MPDQLTLPIENEDDVELGTALGIQLEGEWRGMGKYLVTREGKPGGEFCGGESWGVGTVVWL